MFHAIKGNGYLVDRWKDDRTYPRTELRVAAFDASQSKEYILRVAVLDAG